MHKTLCSIYRTAKTKGLKLWNQNIHKCGSRFLDSNETVKTLTVNSGVVVNIW
jgi:hypothetical protein